jgi:hypothetical protein
VIQPYVYQEFPKWKYHPDAKPLIVDNHDAELALGPDWYDSPAEAEAALRKLRETIESASPASVVSAPRSPGEPPHRGPGRPPKNPIIMTTDPNRMVP